MLRALGYFLLSLPFLFIFVFTWKEGGIIDAILVFGFTGGVVGTVILGAYLITR